MKEWQTFFDQYAPLYLQEVFTRNTLAEVDFLIEELSLPAGSAILDMGCGVGRHAIELARHGYRLTGVDLSSGMLAEAKKRAQAAGVQVEWLQADATGYHSPPRFDAAICLCEGAFGLVALDEDAEKHDPAILRNITAALKPGAPFILTALNGLRAIRHYGQPDVDSGAFDPLTLIVTSDMEYPMSEGPRRITLHEKFWLPQQLADMCEQAGLQVLRLWGGTAGSWQRAALQLDEMEVMIIARKYAA